MNQVRSDNDTSDLDILEKFRKHFDEFVFPVISDHFLS